MITDVNSLVFFLVYIAVTSLYGFYMYTVGVRRGIGDTLITISQDESTILKEAMKALERKAIATLNKE